MKAFKNIPNFKDFKQMYPHIKAVVFDMDGTLVDTEVIHAKACEITLKKFNSEISFSWEVFEERYIGLCDEEVFDDLIRRKEISDEIQKEKFLEVKIQVFLDLLKETPKTNFLRDEMTTLINDLSSNGLEIALVTASERDVMRKIIEITDLEDMFLFCRAREDSKRTKPYPDPYLDAIEILNLLPEEILVFEDSDAGYKSASAAGLKVLKVSWFG